MFKKILFGLLAFLVIIGLIYILGPKPSFEEVDFDQFEQSISIENVETYIDNNNAEVEELKPGNEAMIVWADSSQTKTEYALVYLHGFSASHEEGNPVHREFAKRTGMNLYLSLLADHGRSSEDSFKDLTASDFYASAEEALEIGKALGQKVVVMSCSTGGTLSAMLATEHPEIHSFIMFSPNIDIADPASNLTTGPWGQELLELTLGGEYNQLSYGPEQAKYWNSRYHVNGIIMLKHMLDNYMTKQTFETIDQPIFMGYYYKDEEHQDNVVSVPRMLDFFDQISTPEELKKKKAYPNARGHVFTAEIFDSDYEKPLQDALKWWNSLNP